VYIAAPDARIHPSADISDGVRIGSRSQIWDLVRIREESTIGVDCILGRGVYIDTGVTIGDRVKIQNDALVYHGTTVEAGVFIGPGAILTNDRFPRSVTVDGRLARAADWTVSQIRLSEGCSIGAGAVIVAGCDVGRYATVGAGTVVTRSVPDHALVAGNPGALLGWVCRCGQRLVEPDGSRAGPDHEGEAECPEDRTIYVVDQGQRCQEVPR
jgi:UDP-2-acetamido-3-amino-2,3-dideoxy-glucuronate N-acetyltransferase